MKMETVVDLCLGTDVGAAWGVGLEQGLGDSCAEPEAPKGTSERQGQRAASA